MAKLNLNEQLDQTIDAILARRESKDRDSKKDARAQAKAGAEFAALARIAADLRDLPGDDFKTILKADLIRRAVMTATGSSAAKAAAVPETQTAIPRLCFKDAARAIEFYKKVFGATEMMRLNDGDKIGTAEIQIGNSRIMLSDEFPEYGAVSPETLGGSTVRFKLMVPDVDVTASHALAAGAKMVRPVQDQFYGDRSGQFADPFGYTWIIATHKEDVSADEMQRRLDEWRKQPGDSIAEKMAARKPEAPTVNYIREGFHTITPYILVGGAAKFIEFMKEAFDAEEKLRVPLPDGKIMHAEVKLGDSMIELSDGNEQYGPSPVALHFYVDDADATYARALEAGATSLHEMVDQSYGDREGGVKDPFGNTWFIATPKTYTPMPGQLGSVQPYLFLREADKMIPFLESAFGAQAEGVAKSPKGEVLHATIRIGDNTLEISEAHGPLQQSPCHLHLYVPDTDAVYEQALRAGATIIEAPNDKPYGDRSAGVRDAWGNSWFIATHIKDVAF